MGDHTECRSLADVILRKVVANAQGEMMDMCGSFAATQQFKVAALAVSRKLQAALHSALETDLLPVWERFSSTNQGQHLSRGLPTQAPEGSMAMSDIYQSLCRQNMMANEVPEPVSRHGSFVQREASNTSSHSQPGTLPGQDALGNSLIQQYLRQEAQLRQLARSKLPPAPAGQALAQQWNYSSPAYAQVPRTANPDAYPAHINQGTSRTGSGLDSVNSNGGNHWTSDSLPLSSSASVSECYGALSAGMSNLHVHENAGMGNLHLHENNLIEAARQSLLMMHSDDSVFTVQGQAMRPPLVPNTYPTYTRMGGNSMGTSSAANEWSLPSMPGTFSAVDYNLSGDCMYNIGSNPGSNVGSAVDSVGGSVCESQTFLSCNSQPLSSAFPDMGQGSGAQDRGGSGSYSLQSSFVQDLHGSLGLQEPMTLLAVPSRFSVLPDAVQSHIVSMCQGLPILKVTDFDEKVLNRMSFLCDKYGAIECMNMLDKLANRMRSKHGAMKNGPGYLDVAVRCHLDMLKTQSTCPNITSIQEYAKHTLSAETFEELNSAIRASSWLLWEYFDTGIIHLIKKLPDGTVGPRLGELSGRSFRNVENIRGCIMSILGSKKGDQGP